MDIKIIDDFISKEEFNIIKSTLLYNNFPWFLRQVLDDEISQTYDYNFQLVHIFYAEEEPSIFFDILHPVLDKLKIVDIHVIKSNLLTRTDKIVKHGFHVDILDTKPNHRTSILYINNCDGYTEFEDGTKVYSKENRLVTFPTNIRHTGTTCTNNHLRLVINFNYTI
tara:strand:+ start:103 stop:603 length:501 start_codon:yes stop_codon:yes gene_type:complete